MRVQLLADVMIAADGITLVPHEAGEVLDLAADLAGSLVKGRLAKEVREEVVAAPAVDAPPPPAAHGGAQERRRRRR